MQEVLTARLPPKLLRRGVSIVVVGGAITKAENAEETARVVKQAMLSGRPVETKLYRKFTEEELVEAFKKVSTPNIADAMHRKGAMKGIVPITLEG